MSNDQPGTGQPSWQPPQGEQPPTYGQPPAADPYGQPPVAPPAPAYGQQPGYGQAPAYGQGFPAAPAYAAGGYQQAYAGPELASWGVRVGANIIDGLVMNIPYFIGYVAFLAGSGVDSSGKAGTPSAGATIALLIGSLLTFGLWIWNRGIKQGRTGQSIGKKVLGLRLVKEMDGQPMGTGMSLLRDVAHVVDQIFLLGYLWPLWDAKKQTFADKMLTTIVVKG